MNGQGTARTQWSAFRQRGFGLVEVLVTLVILGVGILALLAFHGESQRNLSDTKARAEALRLASEKLAELESFLKKDDLRLINDGTFEDPQNPIAGTLAQYQRSWEVAYADEDGDGDTTDCSDDSAAGIYCPRLVRVQVAWQDRDGNPQQVELASEVYFHPPAEQAESFLELVDAEGVAAAGGFDWVTGDETADGGDQPPGDGGGGQTGGGDTPPGGGGSEPATFTGVITLQVDAQGSLGGGKNATPVKLTGIQFSGSQAVVCSGLALPAGSGDYTCVAAGIPVSTGASWTVQVSTNGNVCAPSGGSAAVSVSSGSPTASLAIVLRKNSGSCP
ncbi:MAG: hypothetical protein KatS3mg124_1608 [Porticoccaceae bacterium]|nr:MAG: hypothetical protein KatS3mg124_1608 [Porticoccaceae bacterium]